LLVATLLVPGMRRFPSRVKKLPCRRRRESSPFRSRGVSSASSRIFVCSFCGVSAKNAAAGGVGAGGAHPVEPGPEARRIPDLDGSPQDRRVAGLVDGHDVGVFDDEVVGRDLGLEKDLLAGVDVVGVDVGEGLEPPQGDHELPDASRIL